jgi:hypothetical protein
MEAKHKRVTKATANRARVPTTWRSEVEKRLDEVLSGQAKPVPAAKVFASLRSKYG